MTAGKSTITNRRGPSHAGPYGLVCLNCFKAKSKCVAVSGPETTACQRCHRLGKHCRPSDSIRQRGVEKKPNTSTSRISKLEDKVESLLAQLQSRNGKDPAGPLHNSTPEEHIIPSIEVDSDTSSRHDFGEFARDKRNKPNSHYEVLVNKFRKRLLPNFPFMHLPDTLTAETLKTEWPILFAAIIFVSSLPRKASHEQDLKRSMYESILEFDHSPTNLEKIDLLLAVLTYLSWGCDHVFHEGSMPHLMAQAVSLATEMTHSGDDYYGNLMEPAAHLFRDDQRQHAGVTTQRDFFLDRRRAILGCFVLNSAVSMYFGCINTFRWTMKMEESLAAIRSNKDCPSDGQLSLLIRLQLLAEKASQVQLEQKLKYQKCISEAAISPAVMSLVSLRNELHGLCTTLPQMATYKTLLTAHAHSVESRLGQITHAVSSTVPVMMTQLERMVASISAGESIVDGTAQTKTARSDQMISLWHCMQSSVDCIVALLDMDADNFCYISFLQWSQLAHSVACLQFLTNTIEDQGWDRQAVRTRVDMTTILDRVIGKLRSASEMTGVKASDNAFGRLAQRMSAFRGSITDDHAQQNTTQRETAAAWERSKVNGGGRGASPCNISRLEDTFKRTRGPFDYVFE